LRASRPGDAVPDEEFVDGLYDELAAQQHALVAPNVRALKFRRGRAALVAVAAGMTLIGGTFGATLAFDQGSVNPAAVQAPSRSALRTATFETADHRVMGQIVAYAGSPSWVFMSVAGSDYSGTVVCTLQAENGSTVATGAFELDHGIGKWSKTIHVDVGRLRGAKLVTSSGNVVASATFA
jgi:hypothetical protein